MKQALLASAVGAIWACAGPALAADIGGPAYGPAPVPAFSWTGIYAGVNIGDGWKDHETLINGSITNSGLMNGVIGGGQVGANWQIGSVVLGVETDVQGSSQSRSGTSPFSGSV